MSHWEARFWEGFYIGFLLASIGGVLAWASFSIVQVVVGL